MPTTRRTKDRSRTTTAARRTTTPMPLARKTLAKDHLARRRTKQPRGRPQAHRQFQPLEPSDLDVLLSKQNPQGRVLTARCINFVLDTVPSARACMGEGTVDFQGRGPLCFVAPEPDGCRLGFRQGPRLYDPKHRLRGTDADQRFIHVGALEDLNSYTAGLLLQACSGRP
jgi:hypothetical protein